MNFIARVKKLEKINDAVFELTLVHDNDLFYFSAGQYVWIQNKYGRRAFSISSSSTNPKELKILFKTGIESDYMKFMSILKIGDTLTLVGPRGTLRIPDTQSKSVYLSGGVGITPFLSILRSLKDKNISRDITLVSVNSNESVELYKDELLQMANNDSQLKIVYLQGKLKKDDLIKINNSNKESDLDKNKSTTNETSQKKGIFVKPGQNTGNGNRSYAQHPSRFPPAISRVYRCPNRH